MLGRAVSQGHCRPRTGDGQRASQGKLTPGALQRGLGQAPAGLTGGWRRRRGSASAVCPVTRGRGLLRGLCEEQGGDVHSWRGYLSCLLSPHPVWATAVPQLEPEGTRSEEGSVETGLMALFPFLISIARFPLCCLCPHNYPGRNAEQRVTLS